MNNVAEQQLTLVICGSGFDDLIQAVDNGCEAYVDAIIPALIISSNITVLGSRAVIEQKLFST
jgi:hypothetical protein